MATSSSTTQRSGADAANHQDRGCESNPHFTHDEKRVAFTRANNLYVIALDDGAMRRADRYSPGRATSAAGPRTEKGTESQEALKKEEKDLLEVIRERAAEREEEKPSASARHPRKPFILQAGQTIASLQLTPDEKYVIASDS